jgi:hypothetical protein
MVREQFVSALMDVRKRFPKEHWLRLVNEIRKHPETADPPDIASLVPDVLTGDGVWLLNRALGLRGSCSWQEVAGAMAAVDLMADAQGHSVTPVWTGPANGVFPVRRFDQVLYDLV